MDELDFWTTGMPNCEPFLRTKPSSSSFWQYVYFIDDLSRKIASPAPLLKAKIVLLSPEQTCRGDVICANPISAADYFPWYARSATLASISLGWREHQRSSHSATLPTHMGVRGSSSLVEISVPPVLWLAVWRCVIITPLTPLHGPIAWITNEPLDFNTISDIQRKTCKIFYLRKIMSCIPCFTGGLPWSLNVGQEFSLFVIEERDVESLPTYLKHSPLN